MIHLAFRPVILALCLSLVNLSGAQAANWPQWRGSHGDSTSDETNLPVKWSSDAGIVWKCPLPGEGTSTPAIWGDAIFLTGQQGENLFLYKISKASGKIEWSQQVGSGSMRRGSPKRKEQVFNNLHNLASPSPATDGERVVVHFGNGDLAAYDFAGKQLWRHNLQKDHGDYTIWWGHANSPVLWKDLVISVCMQDSLADLPDRKDTPAPSYLVAHDKKTGEQKWKTPRMAPARSEECDSYTTPVFFKNKDRVEMIVMGGNQIDAYDPETGKQLWFLPGIKGGRTVTGPTLAAGLVYCTQGKKGPFLAIRLGGLGKLGTDAIAWTEPQGTPDTPCPVVWKDHLFWVSDEGFAQCRDAKTGELKWKERLRGDFKPTPLAADGKIYFLNRSGQCTVVAAAPKFEKLAENQIDDETTASPVVCDGKIYLRGKKALWCIGSK